MGTAPDRGAPRPADHHSPARGRRFSGLVWAPHGTGARFTDVDGNTYVDFNVCDMSAVLGYAHPRLTETITAHAARGVHC
jgi:glutamate-1-semialdehyde aminotransferase